MDPPLIVQAEYTFKGGNNDELCFKKGDLITVTQREEGGWWEGTLGEKTAWFPSNYVNEYKAPLPVAETIRPPEEIQEYRSVVLKDLLESEKAHVTEIQGLLENFLEPLQTSEILTTDEYAQLMCNFVEVVQIHDDLYTSLEDCNDRVGKLFLSKAPILKNVHQAYCAAHPRAIVILDKYKDELEKFMERQGAACPGLLVLTTGLSKPFRRLDKYSSMLQELERHMESSHPDRGDTQRSVAVYKDIAATCSATRRQKELELQVLTGPVRGWQGNELSTLGDIIHMGSVAVGSDHRDRYFVLFPQTLLILSVSQRMSAFIYEGKLHLAGIVVNRLEDTDTLKNAFEISGSLIERIVAVCQGPNEANKWVDLLSSSNASMPINIKRNVSSASMNAPQIPSHSLNSLDARGYCSRFSLCAYNIETPKYRITLPPQNYPPTAPYASLNTHFRRLVKNGILRQAIVKALLYPQSRQRVKVDQIVMRRKHKTSVRLGKPNSISSDKSNLSRQDAFELPTDSESDRASCDSSPFEYIKFHTNKPLSDSDRTDYETFIDHDGEDYDNLKHCSSLKLIKLDSLSLEESDAQVKKNQKDSLIICSKAVCVPQRKSSEHSIIHTSTARLNLGQFQHQVSENSEFSLFDGRLSGNYVACEDLANLDENTEIKLAKLKANGSPEERHSMPNLFVGNRFNRNDTTEVYIPSWKDRTNMLKQSVDRKDTLRSIDDDDINDQEMFYEVNDDSFATHSSSIDLPAIMPGPDQLLAELLYNYDNSIIPPPEMFESNENVTKLAEAEEIKPSDEIRLSLKKEASPFKKHSINSDKKLNHQTCINKPQSKTNHPSSIRRCISYQYVHMNNDPDQDKERFSRHHHENENRDSKHTNGKCKCCASSQCPSPRSSDSGMAGSCTIASPDPPNKLCDEFYDFSGDHDGAAEGRTILRHSQSNVDLTRFDVCGMFRNKFLTQEEDIDQNRQQNYSGESSQSRRGRSVEPPVSSAPLQINTKSIIIGLPLQCREQVGNGEDETMGMFKTGLYAHWWKKEKLPMAVVRGIVHAYSKESQCSSCRTECCSCCQDLNSTGDTTTTTSSCPGGSRCSLNSGSMGSDVASSKSRNESSEQPIYPPNTSTIPTQTEPIVQSSSQLQSISHSTSTTSSSSSATTTKSSAKSSNGSAKPQIKFSPNIEQYFEDDKYTSSHRNKSATGTKRKDRKHKS